jgi:hypothetical protein
MTEHVGNCAGVIEWNNVISRLAARPGHLPMANRNEVDDPDFKEITDALKNWDENNINWINYYSHAGDFSEDITTVFADFFNYGIERAWISELRPGWHSPWHWDFDNSEKEYLKKGELVRLHCHIVDPQPGQVVIVKDEAHYSKQKGDAFLWDSYRDWHAGTNCGYGTKYTYHFLGYRR